MSLWPKKILDQIKLESQKDLRNVMKNKKSKNQHAKQIERQKSRKKFICDKTV